MFSATMPESIKKLAKTILNNPDEVKITPKNISNENISQYFYVLDEEKRKEALLHLLNEKKPYKSIIFCKTKIETEKLGKFLEKNKIKALVLHGDVEQRKRQEITKKFKSRDFNLLVATDVAARGLDIKNVSHVFNFHIPQNSEPYVHRIGRTGMAGKTGEAHTFVAFDEVELLKNIEKDVKSKLIAAEIRNQKDKNFDSLVKLIINQEITRSGNKLITSLIKENGGEEGLLEKIISYIAEKEIKDNSMISLSKEEAEKIVENYQEKKRQKPVYRRKKRGFGANEKQYR
jgi:ATP-dependent RNA helicase DeaD